MSIYNPYIHMITIQISIWQPFVCDLSASSPLPSTQTITASALQSFQLGAGHPADVAVWTRSFPMPTKKTSHVTLNPNGKKVWLPHGPTKGKCLWEMHDVWGWDISQEKAVVLRESYFLKHPTTGKDVGCAIHPALQVLSCFSLGELVYGLLFPSAPEMDEPSSKRICTGEDCLR